MEEMTVNLKIFYYFYGKFYQGDQNEVVYTPKVKSDSGIL